MGTAGSETGRDEPVTVFLLDDHEIVRRGVRDMLEAEGDITVIGEAGTAASALARIPALRPDVAVLDVRRPDGDEMAIAAKSHAPTGHSGPTLTTEWDHVVAVSNWTLAVGARREVTGRGEL